MPARLIAWLDADGGFPPVEHALAEPAGLLAASFRLDDALIEQAYQLGIYPKHIEGEPMLWWSPEPRMVLEPERFRVARSFRRVLRQVAASDTWEVRADGDFEATMRACAEPTPERNATWITERMCRCYSALARRGLAHSIEVLHGGTLVGGLYVVALGRVIFGESMFSRVPEGSKIALAALVRIAQHERVALIDCQQTTRHLGSLGAHDIPRARFCQIVARASRSPAIDWSLWRGHRLNALLHGDWPAAAGHGANKPAITA